MDGQGEDVSSIFQKPSNWNIWARVRSYRWHNTSGTSTPRSPYKTNIDDLAGCLSRRGSPHASTLSLPDTVGTQSSWRTVFETSNPKRGEMTRHLTQNIVKDNFLTMQLLLLTIVTGILDAGTYTKYHVFTTKQTGNMLFLAVSVFDPGHLGYKVEVNIGVSILAFICGGVVFGLLANVFRPKRRSWILCSLLFQTLLIFIATGVRYAFHEREIGAPAYVVIALLAFASAGQITVAVGAGESSLNTVMITGAIVQLTADRKILKKHNAPRNSRICFIALYIAGCFVGAASRELSGAMPFLIAGCLKLAVLPSFIWNRGDDPVVKRDVEMQSREKREENANEWHLSAASTSAAPQPG